MNRLRRYVIPGFPAVGAILAIALFLAAFSGCSNLAPPPGKSVSSQETSSSQGAGGPSTPANPLANALQLLQVTTPDWDSSQATLTRYERPDAHSPWRQVGPSREAVIGKHGLGWGRGLHGEALGPGPVKREGDLKAPAGVFSLGTAFAYDPQTLGFKSAMPMRAVDEQTMCVENPDSRYYNVILEKKEAAVQDWGEQKDMMLRPDGLYRYGLFVNHNYPQPESGRGSCIFFHVWRGPGSHTAGCTAMTPEYLLETLRWLDASRRPVLVQFPGEEMKKYAGRWGAPTPADGS